MDDPLQLMHRLAAHKDSIDTATKWQLGRVVTQVRRAPQLSELRAGLMQPGTTRGGSQTLEQKRGRSVAIVDGSGNAQQLIEFGMHEIKIQVAAQDRFEARYGRPAARQV